MIISARDCPWRTQTKPTEANLKKAVAELKEELGDGFIVDYLEPFCIAGNISKEEFDRLKNDTIKECSAALFKDYFDKKPNYILKVYLFKDANTYDTYVKKIKSRNPPYTPFGFYQDKNLIMNIDTGNGTLIHEMVHALIMPDFPDVPAWFNEGLGSLYEQCHSEQNGSLRGLINWRYKGLMKAFQSNKLIPLKKIFRMSHDEFYDDTNCWLYVAQVRYFCLYLQENKVLLQFYKKFRDNFTTDKTGIKFIEEFLKKPIDEVDENWQKWIVKVNDINELR